MSRSAKHFRRCAARFSKSSRTLNRASRTAFPHFAFGAKVVAGFAAFQDHLSYLPFSGSVLEQLGDELREYTMTNSALHFPVDRPLPKKIVETLIAVRLAEMR
jgi:uncharacterized protein YdhG (YjbR/CyaY superfamily)